MTDDQHALLTMSTYQLEVRWKMPRDEVRKRRLALLGRARAIKEPWVRAVGSWGGVRTAAEIGDLVGRSSREVRDYSKGMDLFTRTRTRALTHPELAVRLWCDRARPMRESCRAFGVLPVERYVLCAHLQDLVEERDGGIADVLCGTVGDLHKQWAWLGNPFARKRSTLEELFEAAGPLIDFGDGAAVEE